MARVNIPGVGMTNFPDSMSDEQILAQAREMQTRASQPLFDPKDLPTSQIIKGGFSRGLEGLKGTALDLIPALGGAAIPFSAASLNANPANRSKAELMP